MDTLVSDLNVSPNFPKELQSYKTAGERDIFFRRVNFQHWLMASHPDRDTALWNVTTNANGRAQASKFNGDGATTLALNGATNFELGDCQSQGGQLHLRNLVNARETGNYIGNEMGYCWAEMGGGAHYVVSENNDLHASTSWGYGKIAMRYVYSAHNRSYNFVRGEREAMTLDISATPATGFDGKQHRVVRPARRGRRIENHDPRHQGRAGRIQGHGGDDS